MTIPRFAFASLALCLIASSLADDTQLKKEPSLPICYEVDLPAAPQRVYQVLTDAKQFSACTGAPADISADVGGAFSIFDGHIIGRHLDMVPGKRLVQAWRVVDWPPGVALSDVLVAPSGRADGAVGAAPGWPVPAPPLSP